MVYLLWLILLLALYYELGRRWIAYLEQNKKEELDWPDILRFVAWPIGVYLLLKVDEAVEWDVETVETEEDDTPF